MAKNSDGSLKILGDNRKARYHYTITEKYECGIELKGTEVKAMRAAHFAFRDSYARIIDNELILCDLHITPYEFGNIFNHDPNRKRRLLVHKEEIKKLKRKTDEKGCTLVPLKFYLKNGRVKLELGVGTGKKLHDKRASIKDRDSRRAVDRELRQKG